jgi:hypothetical protein
MFEFADTAYEFLVGAAFFMAIAVSLIKIIMASIASDHALEG